MIRHIVLFKIRDEEATSTKLNTLKELLLALQDKVDVVKAISVGLNENPSELWHIALTVDLESFEALAVYAKHPEHLEVGKQIRAVLESRSCVDFTI